MTTELKAQLYIFGIDAIGLVLAGAFGVLGDSMGRPGVGALAGFITVVILFGFTVLSIENIDDIVEWLDSRNKPKDNPKPGAWKEKE